MSSFKTVVAGPIPFSVEVVASPVGWHQIARQYCVRRVGHPSIDISRMRINPRSCWESARSV